MPPDPSDPPATPQEYAQRCEARWDDPAYARLSAQQAAPFAAWAVNLVLSKANQEFAPCPASYQSWEGMMHELATYLYPRMVGSSRAYGSGFWSEVAWQLKFVCDRIADDPTLGPNGPWAPLVLPLLEHYFQGGREPDLMFPPPFTDALRAMPRWWELDPLRREESACVRRAVGQINAAFRPAGIVFDPPENHEAPWQHFSERFVVFLVPQLANPLHATAAGEALGAIFAATVINRPYGVASTQGIRFCELLSEAISEAPAPFRVKADGTAYGEWQRNFINHQVVTEMSPVFADWLRKKSEEEAESLRQGAMGY